MARNSASSTVPAVKVKRTASADTVRAPVSATSLHADDPIPSQTTKSEVQQEIATTVCNSDGTTNTTKSNEQSLHLGISDTNHVTVPTDNDPNILVEPAAPAQDPQSDASTALSISELHPFLLDDWRLVARVVSREEPTSWTTERSSGTRLCIHLIDGNGDMIKATIFNNAIKQFLPLVSAGSCCCFSAGNIKFANRSFSHDTHELSFDDRSVIVSVPSTHVPTVSLRVCSSITDLNSLPDKSIVTVLGIVTKIGHPKRLVSKRKTEILKREILIIDKSNAQLMCVLWNGHAKEEISCFEGSSVLIRGGEINDYNDSRSLNVGAQTVLVFQPNLQDAENLTNKQRYFCPTPTPRVIVTPSNTLTLCQ